jgi:mono/diheme cytochrome c family protein
VTHVSLYLLLLALPSACTSDASGGSVDGPTIFTTMCATCHGPTGQPPASMVAQLRVKDLTSAELRARITPALVEHQIRTGSENKLMPSFQGVLKDEQIKAVSAYVASPGFIAR